MTKLEAAIKAVSDLRDFYRRIPKVAGRVAEDRPQGRSSATTKQRLGHASSSDRSRNRPVTGNRVNNGKH